MFASRTPKASPFEFDEVEIIVRLGLEVGISDSLTSALKAAGGI